MKDQSVCSAFVPDGRFCAASSCSILLLYHSRSCRPSISKILICISPKVIALANLEKGPHPLVALPPSLSLSPARSSARRRTKGALDGGGTSSFPSQNTLSPPGKWAQLLPMPALCGGRRAPGILSDCLMWPFFKHSDHPAKLRLMDGARHSPRAQSAGGRRIAVGREQGQFSHTHSRTRTNTHTHTPVLCSLSETLCARERRPSQSRHLGLNNPRCHYLGHLSVICPTPPTTHTITSHHSPPPLTHTHTPTKQ